MPMSRYAKLLLDCMYEDLRGKFLYGRRTTKMWTGLVSFKGFDKIMIAEGALRKQLKPGNRCHDFRLTESEAPFSWLPVRIRFSWIFSLGFLIFRPVACISV